jgi:hypothetical protein
MSRITSSDFLKQVERLQEVMGVELTTNIWHKHYSVYTKGDNDSCQSVLVSSNTARDAVDQIGAILNALYVMNKKRGTK